MKAVQIARHGGPEVMEVREVRDPVAGPGQIVADIHAASVNPGDIKVRKGLRPQFMKDGFPHTLGRDFSGVVRLIGSGVVDFRPGDRVFAVLPLGTEGAYAEAIAIDSALAAVKPDALSHVDIVAVALTGLTSLYAMEDAAAVRRGETVLIHGGAGGIGSFAVQYAAHVGARVITTASARNHDYVRRLGAAIAIDYNTADFTTLGAQCDVVFDTIGGDVQRRSLSVLRSGGRLVSVAATIKDAQGVRDDVQIIRPVVSRDRKHLERIAELVVKGGVRPPEIRRFPLAAARAAHELLESGTLRGKIVLETARARS